MKLSVREQWMLAVLPAVLTGVFYFGLSASPAATEREKLRKQIASQGPLSVRLDQVRRAQEERAEISRAIAAQARADAMPGTTFDRNRALQFVSQIAQSRGLTLISSAPDSAAKLPPSLQEAAAAATTPGGAAPTTLWRIELQGPYGSMLEMLEGLRTADTFIVPLSVTMQTPGKDQRKPLSWVLTLWL